MNRSTCQSARAGVVAAALTLLAACGGGSSGGDKQTVAPQSSVDSQLAAKVPASIKSDGVIKVGTDTTYAPSEFLDTDGKTAIGFDIDLFRAVGQKLGLKTTFTTAPFPTLIQAVQSGKFEIGVSSFTVNSDREKEVTMVSYFDAGTQWATKKGNPSGIQPDNACGHKVAVQQGTVQVDDLQARTKKCKSAGKKGITIDQYAAQDDATNAAISGKDDAMLADSPVCAYAVQKTNGQLQLLGDIYDAAPYGYVLPKAQTQFGEAIKGALAALIADGTYKRILTKWGVQQGAISNPEVNPSV